MNLIEIKLKSGTHYKTDQTKDEEIFSRIDKISYDEFFHAYMLRNVPCILSSSHTESWPSRRDWIKEKNGGMVPDLTRNVRQRERSLGA